MAEDGRTITTTGNHPYLTKESWKKAADLREGMEIAAAKEETLQINENGRVWGDGSYASQPLARKELQQCH